MAYKRILEQLIFSALFLSPLLHISIENSSATRLMWSGLALISFAVIVFFCAYPFRVQTMSRNLLLPITLIAISSFFLATNTPNAFAVYLAALAILMCLAIKNILNTNKTTTITFIAVLLGCFALYAQWGIAQFIVQHDLGMGRIGESHLTTTIPGIASFYVSGEKYIRAYGPFGHANSFAGVLLLGIILLYKYVDKLRSNLFVQSMVFIISLGIIVSFSRTALAGLVLLAVLFAYKKLWRIYAPIIMSFLLFIPLLLSRSIDTHGAAAHERLVGLGWFTDMMNLNTAIRGFGLGNYTNALASYLKTNEISHNVWEIAPVHSVPLLLLSELGLIISILIFILLVRHIIIRKAWILLALLPALLLDHYFVTDFSSFILLITTARLVVQ